MKKEYNQIKLYELIFAGSIYDDMPLLINDVKIEDHGFDKKLMRKGISLLTYWPNNFTIYIEGLKPVDYLLCRGSYPLISNRVKKTIETYQSVGVEFLPVKMIYLNKAISFDPYWVINIYKVVDALDWNNTVWITSNPKEDPFPHMAIIKPAINYDLVENINIFRLIVKNHVLSNIYISSFIAEKLKEIDATIGMEFIPIKTINNS